ncbi:MAG TPA: response regulator transcription factor, partial [Bryobacteraceae bacterium]|nr:response regulator transcription factor [Bryobacteraceae bacterium]
MKTLIVDDEPIARRILREGLETLPEVVVVAEAANGKEALVRIAEFKPDLVFLDLQMPIMGGFEVVRELRGGPSPVIIIVTAFDQYAIDAFEAGAIDYLLKPVSEARIRRAVERVRKLQGNPIEISDEITRIGSVDSRQPSKGQKFVGRVGEEYFFLDEAEILAFQAERELVWIVTSKQRLLATQSLRKIEDGLRREQFLRV